MVGVSLFAIRDARGELEWIPDPRQRHTRVGYEYDAYGNCSILEPNFAPDPDGKSDYGNNYLFTGRRLDILDSSSLKIQYNRNRYYDYYTGRWLTHDPLDYVDGMNLYEYARSRPLILKDPLGLLFCDDKCMPAGGAKKTKIEITPVPVGHTGESFKRALKCLEKLGATRGVGRECREIGRMCGIYAGMVGSFHLEWKQKVRCCVLEKCCHPLAGRVVRYDWSKKETKGGRTREYTLNDLLDRSMRDRSMRGNIACAYLELVKEVRDFIRTLQDKYCKWKLRKIGFP